VKDTFSKKPPEAAPGCQQSWLVVRDQVHYFVEPLSDEWVQAVMVAMDAKPLITRPPCALWIHSESIAPGLVKTTPRVSVVHCDHECRASYWSMVM